MFTKKLSGHPHGGSCRSKIQLSSAARPRASATAVGEEPMPKENCITSAIADTVGRRRFRRCRASMSISWTSTPPGSSRRIATTVRTVFRCVASRNRERGPLGPGTKPPSPPSGPNPLGENQSLSSPPLEPRGLLLSVMRQKVGKERSQGVFAPLAIPPRLGSESPTEKIRPCAHPLEALQNPGWSAQRHRRGRRCKASRPAQPNFSAQHSAGISP